MAQILGFSSGTEGGLKVEAGRGKPSTKVCCVCVPRGMPKNYGKVKVCFLRPPQMDIYGSLEGALGLRFIFRSSLRMVLCFVP